MSSPCNLTAREREVLNHLKTGARYKEIASALYIDAGTVKSHVEHIIRKLRVDNRTQAIVWAVRQEGR